MANKKEVLREILFVVSLIVLLTISVVYQGYKKEGFHIDEMFGYTQVANTEYWRVTSDQEDQIYMNHWHDVSHFEDFLTINEKEAFDLKGAWNTAYDNSAHPPLYFVILQFVTSLLFRNHFTKWSGLCTNLPFYIGSLIVLYLLSKKIFQSKVGPSLAVTAIYGISVAAIDTAIFLRMYMMITFYSLSLWTINTFLYHSMLSDDPNKKKKIVGFGLLEFIIIFLGILTHYYFLIFSFFTCGVFILLLLIKKKWKFAISYGSVALLAVGACASICPNFFSDLFSNGRGAQAVEQASSTIGWLGRFQQFIVLIQELLMGRTITIVFFVLLGILVGISLVRSKALLDKTQTMNKEMIVSFTIIIALYVVLISLIAPMQTYRYIINIIPGLILILGYILDCSMNRLHCSQVIRSIAYFLMLILTISAHFTTGILYRYPGYNQDVDNLKRNQPYQAIIVTDKLMDGTFLTPYVLSSQSVYQTKPKNLYRLKENKGNTNLKTLLFVNKDASISTDTILEQTKECLDYKDAKKICYINNARIDVYLLEE